MVKYTRDGCRDFQLMACNREGKLIGYRFFARRVQLEKLPDDVWHDYFEKLALLIPGALHL